jgi:hypothetical protein
MWMSYQLTTYLPTSKFRGRSRGGDSIFSQQTPPPFQLRQDMPSLKESPLLEVSTNGAANGVGVNGHDRPHTPTGSTSMSLTEYSANPSPPATDEKHQRQKYALPKDFLMPDGSPDVSSPVFPPPEFFIDVVG